MKPITKNTLFYGDNLDILRHHVSDESIDLIYLDPPFNSNRNYNVLFKDETGKESPAQIMAFEDTWHWNESAEEAYEYLVTEVAGETGKMISAMRQFIGNNQMMAYLVMMAIRLVELHKVLKPTGSMYLHCDPTASHYLKIVLDTIFGGKNFLNEIIWYYRGAGVPKKERARRHDIIFWYAKKAGKHYFNPDPVRQPYAEATQERFSHYIGNVRDGIDYGQQELNPLGKHPDDVITHIQPIGARLASKALRFRYYSNKVALLLL